MEALGHEAGRSKGQADRNNGAIAVVAITDGSHRAQQTFGADEFAESP